MINAAAYTKVDHAESEVSASEEVNAAGPGHLAQACEINGVQMVQVSTDYVFDGMKPGPYNEEDAPAPRSVYGRTKLAGEKAAATVPRNLIVRTSWVFGDGRNFIRSIIEAARTRDEIAVVDDQVGRLTYAPDLAVGILTLIEKGAVGLFHLTNQGDTTSWADVAEAALHLSDIHCSVRRISTEEYFEGRPGPIAPRPANSVLDCSKAGSLGVALRPWDEALEEYLRPR